MPPGNQNTASLPEILDEIERDANAGLSVNPDRLDCRHNLEKLRLVKALRLALAQLEAMKTYGFPEEHEHQGVTGTLYAIAQLFEWWRAR